MKNFGIWLADSPLGSMFKVALGAVLVYCLDNVASFNLDPIVQVVIISVIPVAINYVNGMDMRYGKVSELD